MASSALSGLEILLGHVDQLERLHGSVQKGKGRRHKQEAIHRAGVVLAVAAWESYVESVSKEALRKLETAAAGNLLASVLQKIDQTHYDNFVKRFNTPNAENVRELMQKHLLFDPWPHWTWVAPPGRNWSPQDMRIRLNEWLQVRHSVAHGFALPIYPFLRNQHGGYTLRLSHLQDSRDFVRHIATQTDQALSQRLVAAFGIPVPW